MGEVDGNAVAEFFFAMEMALQFDIDISGPEDADQVIYMALGLSMPPCCRA